MDKDRSMTLFEEYEEFLLNNNWKDKIEGLDYEIFSYIGRDGAYNFTLKLIDRGSFVEIEKISYNGTIYFIPTYESPEIIIGELLKWKQKGLAEQYDEIMKDMPKSLSGANEDISDQKKLNYL